MRSEYRLGTVALGSGPDFPVAVCQGRTYPLSDVFKHGRLGKAPVTLRDFLSAPSKTKEKLQSALAKCRAATQGFSIEEVVIKTPIGNPSKIVLIGVNYRDHIEEMKITELPEFPYAFLRPPTSLAAHGDVIALPKAAQLIDWEAELGVIIGARVPAGSHADQELTAAVAGYTIVNDLSARDWILKRPPVGIDWVMQKAWDKFQPMGPWITPSEFVPDPQSLDIELTVNGVVKQKSNTSNMVFGVTEILHHIASIMTLEPGDIIATGTPAGVGFGRKPIETIHRGDTVCVSLGSLGTLENTFE